MKEFVVLDLTTFMEDMIRPLKWNRVICTRPDVDRDGGRERLEIEEVNWKPG
jgi:hypothetical protein